MQLVIDLCSVPVRPSRLSAITLLACISGTYGDMFIRFVPFGQRNRSAIRRHRMIIWITENLGNIIVSAVLIATVAFVIFRMIKNKRNGLSSCGCNCSGCSMSADCRKVEKNK